MKIPDQVRKCVVFLGYHKDGRTKWCGTGFFLAVCLPTRDNRPYSYLVTARHVIDKICEVSSAGEVHLRLNLHSGGSKQISVGLDEWRFHPTKEVDVAAIPFSEAWFDDMDHLTVIPNMVADDAFVKGSALGPGDDVFVTGLFASHHGADRNIPIIRVGNIAAMPEEPMRMRLDSATVITADAYLIESRSIGGLSGSPVFVYMAGTNRGLGAYSQIYLLGLIHGHWDAAEPITDGEDLDEELRSSVNMGIAIAVPASAILGTLEHPEFVAHREQLARQLDAEDLPTQDAHAS